MKGQRTFSRTVGAAILLTAPAVPASCHTYWPCEPILGVPALKRLLKRLRAGFANGIPIHVLCGNQAVVGRLKGLPISAHCWCFDEPRLIPALGALFREVVGVRQWAMFPASSLFPDGQLTARLLALHQDNKADFSFAKLAPFGVAPVIVSRQAILRVADLPAPALLSDDPIATFCRLQEVFEVSRQELLRLCVLDEGGHYAHLRKWTILRDIRDLRAAEQTYKELENYERKRRPQQRGKKTALASAARFAQFRRRFDSRPILLEVAKCGNGRFVLYVSRSTVITGAELSLGELVEGVHNYGFSPLVILPAESDFSRLLADNGVPVICTKNDFTVFEPYNLALWEQLIAHFRPALIHINGEAGAAAVSVARTLGVPIIHHIRRLGGSPNILQFSSRVITASRASRLDVIRSGVQPSKVVVIPNGVRLASLPDADGVRAKTREQEKLGESVKWVCMPARISPEKRQDLLLEAQWLAKKDGFLFGVLFTGEILPEDGRYYGRLRSFVEHHDLAMYVRFRGYCSYMAPIYAASDFVVVCNENESMSRVVAEAFHSGRPVLVPDRGAPAELVEDGYSGVVFHSGNARDLALAIRRLGTNCELAALVARNGRQKAKLYSVARHVKSVVGIYSKVILENTGSGHG